MKYINLFFLLMIASFAIGQTEEVEKNINLSQTNQQTNSTDTIYQITDIPAQYPDGPIAFQNWLASQIVYPSEAITKEIEGKVWVSFVVNKEGELINFKILKSVHPLLDEECIRVLKKSPNWIPASHKGRTVNALHRIPISFVLEKTKKRKRNKKL
jgi:TonB family protein